VGSVKGGKGSLGGSSVGKKIEGTQKEKGKRGKEKEDRPQYHHKQQQNENPPQEKGKKKVFIFFLQKKKQKKASGEEGGVVALKKRGEKGEGNANHWGE